jgi:hypothetical protein
MKNNPSISLRPVTPFAWAGALLFFVISEGLVLTAEKHGLSGISLTRRLSLPVALAGPLIIGANFARMFKRRSKSLDSVEVVNLASASTAILVLAAYALLTGTLTVLF